MAKPLVSVIVPAYNEEKFIKRCLNSLLNQDLPKDKYEIIVVDNNCIDKTIAIASSMNVGIIRETEQGLVHARIRGIKEAKGEIIAFLDADSKASPKWLKRMIKVYQKDNNVVGVAQLIDYRPKNILILITQPFTDIANKLFKIMPGGHFSFKKDAYLESGGYSPKVDFNEDVYISKKLKKIGKLVIQKRGLVTSSSRRLSNLKSFFSYTSKVIISTFTISLFDRSFFMLRAVSEEASKKPKHRI